MASFNTADGANIYYEVHGDGLPRAADSARRDAFRSFFLGENAMEPELLSWRATFRSSPWTSATPATQPAPLSASHGWHTYAG